MRYQYWMRFFRNADAATPAGGASPAATPEAAPAAPEVSTLQVDQPKTTVISAAKGLGLPVSPKKTIDAMAKTLLAGVNKTSTPLPPRKPAEPVEPKPEPVIAKAEPEKHPVVEPKPPENVPAPAKFKVGGKEYTAEELEKRMEALEKQSAPAKPAEPAVVPDKAAAEKTEKDRDQAFLKTAAPKYSLSETELDTILSGGPAALAMFSTQLARAELNTRKWLEQEINPILEGIDKRMEPALARWGQIAAYEAQQDFTANYPDLAAHGKVVEQARAALQKRYPAEFAALSPAEQNKEVADNARTWIASITGSAPAAPAAPATPAPAAPRPKPPAAHAPTSTAPSKQNFQRSAAADVMAHS